MKTPMQELFSELNTADPTILSIYSSDGRKFIDKYHEFLVKENEFIKNYLTWVRENYIFTQRGWYKDDSDVVIVSEIEYLTDDQLISEYLENQ